MTTPDHIHLDAVGGVAGDMFVAAMLDALPGLTGRVLADVAAVLPPEEGSARLTAGMSGAIRALRFGLEAPAQGRDHADAHGHGHVHHPHDRDHHHHAHEHHHAHQHHGSGSHAEMVARIGRAALHPGTAERACAILRHLAEAEAHIHGVPVEQVHFHEIADWDSLMDVVAAGSIAAALPGARWSVSALPRGGGMVRTQHGLLPVPAPATAAILTSFVWRDDGIGGERVTPTGAAILRELVERPDAPPSCGLLAATGTGAGTRELLGLPNVLRALIFEAAPAEAGRDRVAVISFDIDDMTGEEIGVATERLRALPGVLDLAVAGLAGKKGRPLSSVRLLAAPDAVERIGRECLAETSTIGLRWHVEERLVLPRSAAHVPGDAGKELRIKRVERPGGGTAKVESDDLAGIATLAGRRRAQRRAEADE